MHRAERTSVPPPEPQDAARVFRNRSYPVLGWIGIGLVVVGATVLLALPGAPLPAVLGILVVAAACTWVCKTVYVETRVELTSESLVVVNPLHRFTVPLSEISEVRSGPTLTIVTSEGLRIRAWAVQAANISLMLGRRSHVDDVAEVLTEAVMKAGGRHGDVVIAPRDVAHMRAVGLITAAAALAAYSRGG
jgi:hypothetical protein